jgi:lipopolysaccharide biosynthesis protein
MPFLRWGANFNISHELAQRLNIEIDSGYCLDYPDGGMFWGKSMAIKQLLDLKLTFEDFEAENGRLDGCLNHAIERMVTYSAFKQGLEGCRVTARPDGSHLHHVNDETMLAKSIASCLEAQQQERLK